MKCPKCKDIRLAYNTQRSEKISGRRSSMKEREDFSAECKKCGWKGEL